MTTYNFSKMAMASHDLSKFRKEKDFYRATTLCGLVDNKIISLAEVRYYGTGKTNTAILWIHSPILGLYGNAVGKAGGYGYNREEAALNQAARAHGIQVPDYCSEVHLLESLAEYLGVTVHNVTSTFG